MNSLGALDFLQTGGFAAESAEVEKLGAAYFGAADGFYLVDDF